MAQRRIQIGSAGQTHGSRLGNISLGARKEPNYAGLARAFGVVGGAIKDNKQEEAEKEAIAIVDEINLRHANSKPEERAEALAEARGKLGASSGFIDKLFLDEDDVTKAYDKASSTVKAVDTKRGAERLLAGMADKSYEEQQKALTRYYNENIDSVGSISKTQRENFVSKVKDHALALDQQVWRKENEKNEQLKRDKRDELMNSSAFDALHSIGQIDPAEITEVSSPEDLEAIQAKYRNEDGTIDDKVISGIFKNLNEAVTVGNGLGLSKAENREATIGQLNAISNTYQDPELFEALWSKSNQGVVPKERYPQEYIKAKTALQVSAQAYKDKVAVSHSQKIKENNDATFNTVLEPLLSSQAEYRHNPSDPNNREQLQIDIKGLETQFKSLRDSGAFVGNAKQEKSWMESIGYANSLLIQNEPIASISTDYKTLRDNKELTKTWMTINGKYLSPQDRVEGGDIVDYYDKMATEEARSSYRRQERIVVDTVNAVKDQRLGSIDSKDVLDSASFNVGFNDKYTSLKNEYEAYAPVIARKAEHDYIEGGGDPLDAQAISLAVDEALNAKFGSRIEALNKEATATVSDAKDEVTNENTTEDTEPAVGDTLRSQVTKAGWDEYIKTTGAKTPQEVAKNTLQALVDMQFRSSAELAMYLDSPEGARLASDPSVKDDIIKIVMESTPKDFDGVKAGTFAK